MKTRGGASGIECHFSLIYCELQWALLASAMIKKIKSETGDQVPGSYLLLQSFFFSMIMAQARCVGQNDEHHCHCYSEPSSISLAKSSLCAGTALSLNWRENTAQTSANQRHETDLRDQSEASTVQCVATEVNGS